MSITACKSNVFLLTQSSLLLHGYIIVQNSILLVQINNTGDINSVASPSAVDGHHRDGVDCVHLQSSDFD